MYSRPHSKETEEDILKLQEEFIKEISKNKAAPAAERKNEPQSQTMQEKTVTVPQTQLENTFESIPTDINIGKIVQKAPTHNAFLPHFTHKTGFPQAKRRDPSITSTKGSIFSQQMKRLKPNETETPIKIIENRPSSSKTVQEPMDTDIPQNSCIVTGAEKDEIHKQNVQILQQMSKEQIIEEREKLLSTMDPAIVTFLKSKRRGDNESRTVSIAEQNQAAQDVILEDVEASNELIAHPDAEKWLNFDTIETGKLTWMTEVEIPKCESGKSYEARFDFAGWLLPYTEPKIDENNRSLYHHGEEPGRPGYTLQELFQLCRSSVNQQKIVALNTIANILALHQSGVYDGLIEVPFEQIFFVLRFCLDDNTPAVLNAGIKAVRNLFFYPIDEACLDNLLGFGLGMVQPIVGVNSADVDDDNTINDQQLAEMDLVKCLARTDILRRIRYIINTVQPSTETVVYCLEILIRLARDSTFITKQLVTCDGLLESIVKHFLPTVVRSHDLKSPYGRPIVQALKLFRILATRGEDVATKLIKRYKIMESIGSYLSDETFSRNSNGLKLQIESLHLWCVFVRYSLALESLSDLEPILWRMLDFHVRNTDLTLTTSYTIQGHVAALLHLLAEAFQQHRLDKSIFIPMLSGLALSKWTAQFCALNEFTCGKLQIATALLKCLTHLHKEIDIKAVAELLCSKGFNIVTDNVRVGSNLLSGFEAHKSGPNLRSVEAAVWQASDHIVPAVHTRSCLPFLSVLSDFIVNCDDYQIKLNFLKHKNIDKYLTAVNKTRNYSLIENWFTRLETRLIVNLLKLAIIARSDIDTALFYEIAVKCLSVFNTEQKPAVEFILINIVFSPSFYPCEALMSNLEIGETNELLQQALNHLDDIYHVYAQVLDLKTNKPADLAIDLMPGTVMPVDWIYSPIILLYSNQQKQNMVMSEAQQILIVANCLRWIYIYESYFPALAKLINPTDRFCRLACTFLGSDTLFLDAEIHDLLEACLKRILTTNENNINFDKPIQGLSNFQDFYTQLLEQYQGVSYGDVLFGNFVLLPLMQRHDVKYRKILWSEYAGIVQVFNVDAEQVMCAKELFLNPPEMDLSVLRCYRKALVMGVIRKRSFLYQVANHHVEAYVARKRVERNENL